MSATREKDQADFDLEAFIDLFDEALMSNDTGVQKTLQHLMIIAALARNHAKHDRLNGPLRRMYDSLHNLNRRIDQLETERSRLDPLSQNKTSTGMALDPGYGAVPPATNTSEIIAERVEDLLKSSYKGSSVGTVNVKIACTTR